MGQQRSCARDGRRGATYVRRLKRASAIAHSRALTQIIAFLLHREALTRRGFDRATRDVSRLNARRGRGGHPPPFVDLFRSCGQTSMMQLRNEIARFRVRPQEALAISSPRSSASAAKPPARGGGAGGRRDQACRLGVEPCEPQLRADRRSDHRAGERDRYRAIESCLPAVTKVLSHGTSATSGAMSVGSSR
jgi:hypothetical protein